MTAGKIGETEIECPFCKKGKVRMFHKEGYLQARVSRISAGAKTTYHKVHDTYKVLEDCPNCGKTKKEIQNNLEGGEEVDHKKLLEKLKREGLPTQIEF